MELFFVISVSFYSTILIYLLLHVRNWSTSLHIICFLAVQVNKRNTKFLPNIEFNEWREVVWCSCFEISIEGINLYKILLFWNSIILRWDHRSKLISFGHNLFWREATSFNSSTSDLLLDMTIEKATISKHLWKYLWYCQTDRNTSKNNALFSWINTTFSAYLF